MKIKHLPFLIGLCLVLESPLLILGAAPKAKAQSNGSDYTVPIMTTGDTAGIGNNRRRRIVSFRSNRVQVAINQAATSIIALLQTSSLVIATRGGSNVSISASIQQALLVVLTGTGNVQVSANQLVSGLINLPQTKAEQLKAQAGNSADVSNRTALAQNLVSSLTGLTAKGRVDPAKLTAAVAAYNAFVKASSGEYLLNPPQEFLAIQSVLSALLNAALTAA